MSSSPSRKSSSSPRLTSSPLPVITTLEKPMPCPPAQSSTALPTLPDCEINASRPAPAGAATALALRPIEGRIRPRLFGPSRRIREPRIARFSDASRRAPSRPESTKPADMITALRTPAASQSRTAPSTRAAGTTMIARSGVKPTSDGASKQGTPATLLTLGIDRRALSLEVTRTQVGEHAAAERVGAVAGAEHHHRARRQQGSEVMLGQRRCPGGMGFQV